ncbi:hypothetical protein FA95DRAFT_1610213 [Auriscalpium vulgare]|uniref:Uncharacterized protein n=1 Tax=Auriscalpium vulgare TaxID=40419 RepID=A0ACB8REG8_9AGAM|nr:hypothetical protein FA95DRAFT_1610213 [Auriscalpium vulgare]
MHRAFAPPLPTLPTHALWLHKRASKAAPKFTAEEYERLGSIPEAFWHKFQTEEGTNMSYTDILKLKVVETKR